MQLSLTSYVAVIETSCLCTNDVIAYTCNSLTGTAGEGTLQYMYNTTVNDMM